MAKYSTSINFNLSGTEEEKKLAYKIVGKYISVAHGYDHSNFDGSLEELSISEYETEEMVYGITEELTSTLALKDVNWDLTCKYTCLCAEGEAHFERQYKDGYISGRTIVAEDDFPGYCPACDEWAVDISDYHYGDTYTCPFCGEKFTIDAYGIDVSEFREKVVWE